MERDIETHIEKDKKILEDPTISPQMRRHIELLMNLSIWRDITRNIQKIIMIRQHLRCIVMKTQKQTSVGFTKIDGRRVII